MKSIPLTQGKFAIVDDEDYENLNQYKWHYMKQPRYSWGYAARHKPGEHGKIIFMHRFIVNAPVGFEVDHINRNGLDNRRENLRICNRSTNSHNREFAHKNSFGYEGVSKSWNKWRARITINNRRIVIGDYDDIEDAARAYSDAKKRLLE